MVHGTRTIIGCVATLLLGGAVAAKDPNAHFLRGDCNRDGARNIADPVAALQFLFGGGALTCQDAADANDDGRVDIADAVAMLGRLFGGEKSLPPPDLEPGADPTPDGLTCDEVGESVTLSFAPRQCVSYPWEALGERDELKGLSAWVESLGGVVEAVRSQPWPGPVCMACEVCVRGYTLFITLSGDAAIAALEKVGFLRPEPGIGPAVDVAFD